MQYCCVFADSQRAFNAQGSHEARFEGGDGSEGFARVDDARRRYQEQAVIRWQGVGIGATTYRGGAGRNDFSLNLEQVVDVRSLTTKKTFNSWKVGYYKCTRVFTCGFEQRSSASSCTLPICKPEVVCDTDGPASCGNCRYVMRPASSMLNAGQREDKSAIWNGSQESSTPPCFWGQVKIC